MCRAIGIPGEAEIGVAAVLRKEHGKHGGDTDLNGFLPNEKRSVQIRVFRVPLLFFALPPPSLTAFLSHKPRYRLPKTADFRDGRLFAMASKGRKRTNLLSV